MCEHAVVHVAAAAHFNLGASPGTAFGLLCLAPASSVGWLALVAAKLGTRAAAAAAGAACLSALALSLALDTLQVNISDSSTRLREPKICRGHIFSGPACSE
jgi:uncharacterized membrane protein YraQ (UPF0718 family)